MPRPSTDSDPLAQAIAPPKDETPEQRAVREQQEAEARRVSDMIDEQIKAEASAMRKRHKKPPIKVLLLGQSESGKSTTVKNFQLAYARNAWLEERASWRSVILLNLVRSVNTILDAVSRELAHSESSSRASTRLAFSNSSDETSSSDDEDDRTTQHSHTSSIASRGASTAPKFAFTEQHRLLQLRLGPLRRVQRDLEIRLGAGATENPGDLRGPATPFQGTAPQNTSSAVVASRRHRARPKEFFVHSRSGWRGALSLGRGREGETRVRKGREEAAEEAVEVIAGCSDDIRTLWEDETVHAVLAKRNIRIDDQPGFFLDDVERITSRNYEPSDDDVIRARLRTMGVQEYSFIFEKGSEAGREWIMYDVGGARSYRSAWYPYFMDVNAIIFLAPISVFDEPLAEDRKVNRLEDSFLLWKAVCSSKLLAKVQLILFLNKCDLLQRKLERGQQIRRSVPTYGDRPNEHTAVIKYFRQQFRDISKKYSPEPRGFYSFPTSVVDIKATAVTLGTVREGILRNHLQDAELI